MCGRLLMSYVLSPSDDAEVAAWRVTDVLCAYADPEYGVPDRLTIEKRHADLAALV